MQQTFNPTIGLSLETQLGIKRIVSFMIKKYQTKLFLTIFCKMYHLQAIPVHKY